MLNKSRFGRLAAGCAAYAPEHRHPDRFRRYHDGGEFVCHHHRPDVLRRAQSAREESGQCARADLSDDRSVARGKGSPISRQDPDGPAAVRFHTDDERQEEGGGVDRGARRTLGFLRHSRCRASGERDSSGGSLRGAASIEGSAESRGPSFARRDCPAGNRGANSTRARRTCGCSGHHYGGPGGRAACRRGRKTEARRWWSRSMRRGRNLRRYLAARRTARSSGSNSTPAPSRSPRAS